jgi:hypothetical protein
MGVANTILIVVGALVTFLGVLTIFYPNLARIINAPGGPRLKAIIAIIIGLILLIVGLAIEFNT